MEPFSWPTSSQPLSAADAERLVAGCGAHREAPAVQHALADLLDSAAGPASDGELAGEVTAVAAFVLVTAERRTRSTRFRPPVLHAAAACVAVAVIATISGAAADILPAPIQEVAHTTFGAPAPRHTLARKAAHPGAQPGHATSPNPMAEHGGTTVPGKKAKPKAKSTAKAKATTNAKSTTKAKPIATAPGKAKDRTVPPGHGKA